MTALAAELLEERIAIMIHDGGLSEAEAQVKARVSVAAYLEALLMQYAEEEMRLTREIAMHEKAMRAKGWNPNVMYGPK